MGLISKVAQLREHPYLVAGLILVLAVALIGPVGKQFVDPKEARVGSAMPDLPPSPEYPLGTDTVGRNMLAVIVSGTPLTLRIGLIAGAIGL